MDAAWPTLEKLDSPESTIESDDELCDVARLIGRENRVEGLLAAARWCIRNPDAAATPKGLSDAPNVTPRMAQIASLADPSTQPAPVVASQGSLWVASRVFGLPVQPNHRPGSDGRLAVTRLLGGPASTGASHRVVSSYVKQGSGLVCWRSAWRCVQTRSEMRRLRARMASRLVLPRSRHRW